jgi:hypothetical protein
VFAFVFVIRVLLVVLLSASAPISLFTDAPPPERFQNNTHFTIEVADQTRIDAVCQGQFGAPPSGMKTDACTTAGRVLMPNPCTFSKSDAYARLLCHEMAHVNGWPSTHGP